MKRMHSTTSEPRARRDRFRAARAAATRGLSRTQYSAKEERNGVVLIVIIGLLGLLAIVGFTFYTFASQEQSNAEYFAASEKEFEEANIDPNALFDFAVEQLILGGDETTPNSALFGGRWSMLPNMFGRDPYPFTGPGLNLQLDTTGATPRIIFDQDYDGFNDGAASLNDAVAINDSPAANSAMGANPYQPAPLGGYPQPDVDYTSPDHNNLFLTWKGYTIDPNGRPMLVVRPAFHPAGMMRNTSTYQPINDLVDSQDGSAFDEVNTLRRVLRPHQGHLAIGQNGVAGPGGGQNAFRFVRPGDTLPAGITGAFPFGIRSSGAWNLRRFVSGTAYQVGDWVFPDTGHNGWYYKCVAATAASAGPPTWSTTENATSVSGGVTFEAHNQPGYDFDADPDGDGINEAVRLDLGYPIQDLPDGRQYVPMFSFSVYDTEGLINLAASGNLSSSQLAGMFTNAGTLPSEFLSRSNEGHSTFEINPGYGLTAGGGPGDDLPAGSTRNDVLEQHNQNLKRTGGTRLESSPTWVLNASNAELMFLITGRLEFANSTVSARLAGRNGEASEDQGNYLFQAYNTPNPSVLPRAGVSGTDDDNNRLVGSNFNNTAQSYVTSSHVPIPWQTPMDFVGIGAHYQSSVNGPIRQKFAPGVRVAWILFNNYSSRLNQIGSRFGIDGYVGGGDDNGNDLTVNPDINDALVDDPAETLTDPLFLQPPYAPNDSNQETRDANFLDPADGVPLMLSDLDIRNSGASSRLLELAPWNFKVNTRADSIRDRFSTLSYDTVVSSYNLFNSQRPWERTENGSTVPTFPPLASGANPDPLRPELRTLLQMRSDRANPDAGFSRFGNNEDNLPRIRTQRRLSLNQVAYFHGASGSIWFRDPIPHPADPTLPGNQTQLTNARADRQAMARDIYTLLYLFCHGNDSLNTLTTANTPDENNPDTINGVYSWNQCREMAQFAINYVNMVDADHVIDHFEYDTNLSNGWQPDDDVTTVDGSGDRVLIAGIEEQLLTVSESMILRIPRVEQGGMGYNHPATEYDDSQNRRFAFIELQNASQKRVRMDDRSWRIRIEKTTGTTPKRVIIPKTSSCDAGGRYTIITAGDADNIEPPPGSDVRDSYFRVNSGYVSAVTDPPGIQTFAPAGNTADSRVLDLITDNPTEFEVYTDDIAGATDVTNDPANIFPAIMANDVADRYRIILERRANLRGPFPADSNDPADDAGTGVFNPWVEVDRINDFQVQSFTLTDTSAQTEIQNQLNQMRSYGRDEPLDRPDDSQTTNATFTLAYNSLFSHNITAGSWSKYQLHLNRPLLSRAELLSVPLYGPEDVTRATNWHGEGVTGGADTDVTPAEPGLAGPKKFLSPLHPDNQTGAVGAPNPNRNNRWYRLLNFVEVPYTIRSQPTFPTTPGSAVPWRRTGVVNWNTIRHPEVLAGVLDDTDAFNALSFNPLIPTTADQTTYIPDRNDNNRRDWWRQFILSRDRFDPVSETYLPGMPGSRPFRDFSYLGMPIQDLEDGTIATRTAVEDSGLEHTILRALPRDAHKQFAGVGSTSYYDGRGIQTPGRTAPRRLFELRVNHGTNIGPTAAEIDVQARHKLLSKVMKNTTVRSNTFFVFVQVELFEAAEVSTGGTTVVRIGQKMADQSDFRGVFVVDRSRAYAQIKRANFRGDSLFSFRQPSDEPDPFNPVNGFDWRKLIVYRRQIE